MKIIPTLLTVMVLIFGTARPAHAVTVCKEGPPTCDETSIGAALYDNAYNGQNVTVGPGTYFESNLIVGGTAQGGARTLISQTPDNPTATIIDATGSNLPVIGGIPEGAIRGFTITGGKGGVGSGPNSVLQDLIIEDNENDVPGGGVRAQNGPLTIIDCRLETTVRLLGGVSGFGRAA